MKFTIASLALAASGAAAQQCCFGLTASGGVSGPIGQLGDGQLRIQQTSGLSIQNSNFCLNNGGLTDSKGRGCIFTTPTTQLQCDVGATPSGGLAVNGAGMLTRGGDNTFYACPTGDNGGYNIYSTPIANQPSCVKVMLTTTGSTCPVSSTKSMMSSSMMPSSMMSSSMMPSTMTKTVTNMVTVTVPCSSAAMSTSMMSSMNPTTMATSTMPAPQPSASTCPANLSGNYQYPHLIVPVDSSMPNKAYGTSYNGTVSSTVSSIFNFDIPQSYSGNTCSVVFLFPTQSQLQTSSYTISGSGSLQFYSLNGVASQSTTYTNQPSTKSLLLDVNAQPGNSYVVSTGACSAGQTISIELKATGSYALNYFQDYNPSPIGLYVRQC